MYIQSYLLDRFHNLNATKPNVEDHEYILERANQLLGGIYVFDKTWDMEPCKIAYQVDDASWDQIMNDDEEWVFVRNRMDYLSNLIQAYQISDDSKYLLRCKQMIMNWIQEHQVISYSLSTRTLDTAMRMNAWMDALTYLVGYQAIDEQDLEVIQNSMLAQVAYLYESYVPKYQLSNWGSIQTCCILKILPMLDHELDTIYKWAQSELMKQLELQIYDDGIFWEQSTMYQVEVLMYLMRYYAEEKRCGRVVDDLVRQSIEKMLHSLYALTTPNHYIEAFGDSDRSDTRGIFTLATILLETDEYSLKAYDVLDSETRYEFGNHTYTRADLKHSTCIFDGVDSGMYIVEQDRTYLMFTNGSQGSGHGHCDNLHYSYFVDGQAILVDGGRFTYRDDHPLRNYLKSMASHQSIIVDDYPHSAPKDSWVNERFCIPLANLSKHIGNIHYLHGGIYAQEGYLQRRSIVQLNSSALLVFDDIEMKGEHHLLHKLNFDANVDVRLNLNQQVSIVSGDVKLKLYSSLNSFEIVEDVSSVCYNEQENRFTIKQIDSFNGSRCIATMIVDEGIEVEAIDCIQNGSHVADASLASAYKIIVSEDEYYVVAHVSHEIYKGGKVLEVDGTAFHAKDFLVHVKGNERTNYRLRV